jgi:hypothetical protein
MVVFVAMAHHRMCADDLFCLTHAFHQYFHPFQSCLVVELSRVKNRTYQAYESFLF